MSYGPIMDYTVTFASGATSSTEVDLGRSFTKLLIEYPSATTFEMFVQGSRTTTSGFRRIYHEVTSSDTNPNAIEINSAVAGANGGVVPVPYFMRYMKLESATAVTNGAVFHIIGVD